MTSEESDKMVLKAAVELGEFFDAVQILVTWEENGETQCTYQGVGNVFARLKMCDDCSLRADQNDLADKIAEIIGEHEGWGDDDETP